MLPMRAVSRTVGIGVAGVQVMLSAAVACSSGTGPETSRLCQQAPSYELSIIHQAPFHGRTVAVSKSFGSRHGSGL